MVQWFLHNIANALYDKLLQTDHYFDFSSHGKYSINMVFGSKHAAIMIELHAHIMCDVFDMHYNSSSAVFYTGTMEHWV